MAVGFHSETPGENSGRRGLFGSSMYSERVFRQWITSRRLAGHSCHTYENVSEENVMDRRRQFEPVSLQFVQEIGFTEAILTWVFEEGSIDPAVQRRLRYLFEKNLLPGLSTRRISATPVCHAGT